jgi:hypothetical protein
MFLSSNQAVVYQVQGTHRIREVPSLGSATMPIWLRRFVAGIVTDISDDADLAAQIRRRYCH